MDGAAFNVVWFGWAFACALGVRLGFTHLFRPRLGHSAQFAAYGMWFVLVLVGLAVVSISGMQMYGIDGNDPRQMAGYITLLYSPLGLPTAFGAPAVLALDLLVVAATLMKKRRAV
ncbi:hypothetical protein [Phenylobacterium sp.]|uniref:hypothetical protein n=1 Tax=Phenylobacterium sp. TaxID=1871053 RepID=UPI002731EB72|nr:hypothetical protein [Phenylobacterium sp.]MDP1616170.1 hypothetical protein [Phenylobacterium sp.]MDP1988641.1 hypothetical protein [Phenylobacterium sp.]